MILHERAPEVVLVLRRLGGTWVVEGDRPDGSGRFYETFPRFKQLVAYLRTLEYERKPPAN